MTPSGVIINPSWSFLGASPDGAVYDPLNIQQPYGFLEVKCPYSVKNVTPTEACSHSGFCSRLNSIGQLELISTMLKYKDRWPLGSVCGAFRGYSLTKTTGLLNSYPNWSLFMITVLFLNL